MHYWKKYSIHIIWAVIAIVALAGGFFWGRSASPASSFARIGSGTFGSSTRAGFAGGRGGVNGGGFATGQISAVDSSSLTLQLLSGNSEVVFYSSSTSVTEPTTVGVSAIKVGTNVMIGGTTNSDGILTAQSIQVRTGSSTFPGR